ncbi:MAG: hypothetical protein V4465_01260 [Patescibacteria group bacterium]
MQDLLGKAILDKDATTPYPGIAVEHAFTFVSAYSNEVLFGLLLAGWLLWAISRNWRWIMNKIHPEPRIRPEDMVAHPRYDYFRS